MVASTVLGRALTQMRDLGVEQVLCAGDVFDDARAFDRYAHPGTLTRSFVEPVEKAGLPWLVVEGNHDQAGPAQKGALHVMRGHHLVRVVTRPQVVPLGSDVAVACLPWASRAHFMSQHAYLSPEEQDDTFREAQLQLLQWFRLELDKPHMQGRFSVLLGHCEVAGSTNRYKFILPGSTFNFSAIDLENVGCNLIALGHYHLRQGHYIGALRQLNHGEEGNPTGWQFVDTQTGERRFVEVDCPRYYTVDVADYRAENYRDCDFVKLRGTDAPAQLAPNCTFERQVEAKAAVAREGAEGLDPNGDLSDLVGAWLTAAGNDTPVEALHPLLRDLTTDCPAVSQGVAGSLTRIESITVEGIGPHAHTHVEFPAGEWSAISAPNGGGKTFLLEAPIACWFGTWAHPNRGSIYSTMTADHATINVVFWAGGHRYSAQRELDNSGASPKQKALLTRFEGAAHVPIAGPKVRDFEAAVEALVGPKSLILGSIFLSQKAEGDLVNADPAGRREFLRRYLALDRFDALAETAKQRAAVLDLNLAADQRSVAAIETTEAELVDHEADLNQAINQADILDGQIAVAKSDLDEVRQEGERLSAIQARRDELQQAVYTARKHAEEALQRCHRTAGRISSAQDRLAKAPELRERVATVAKLQAELQQLDEQGRAYDQVNNQVRQWQIERRGVLDRVQAAKRELERQVCEAQSKVLDANIRADQLTRVGCAANPLPCPLIQDATTAKKQLPERQAIEEQLRKQLESEDYAHEDRARAAELSDLVDATTLPELPNSLRVAQLKRDLADLAGVERALGQLEQLERELEQLETDQVAACAEEHAARARVTEAQATLAAAEDVREQLGRVRRDYLQRQQAIEALQREAREVATDRGRAQQAVTECMERLVKLRQLQESLAERVLTRDRWRLLQTALGKDGVPQLLISAAIPAVQDILQDVCQTDFGARFSLRFDTQRENKSNSSVRETFDILFSRGGSEYDARSCSGGEEAAVRAALRTALVLYQASRAGDSYQVAFLDEPAAHQDAEMAEATFLMLQRLRERFAQVLVVSHDEAQLSTIGHVIHLGAEAQVAEEVLA
ncbi:MAG: metallophosphoesterase [Vulcanimicrobiota bacterium]